MPGLLQWNRRMLLGGLGGAALLAPLGLRAQGFDVTPFQLGVAAGDPAPDGFVLWTRLAPAPLEPNGGMPRRPVEVAWEVARDAGFRTVVQRGVAIARPELAHAVHVEVTGLEPGRPYWYRFLALGERSFVGRAATAPAPAADVQQLRFGVAGCQHFEEGWFHAFAALADHELDFLFHYGDYIYEYAPAPPLRMLRGRPFSPVRRHFGGETYSLDDYRLRYAQVKTDPDLQRAHAACAWFVTFDDHEIENNWAADRDESGTPPEIFLLRRAAALQAWYEHMPVRRSAFPGAGGLRMHRHANWGRLLDAHFLDTRQYRSDQACGDGDKALCSSARDPGRTLLGAEQERWLTQGLVRPQGRWNLLAQQVLMMDLDLGNTPGAREPILSMDSWGGYPAARERLLGHIADQRVRNLVVLTGDAHQHFAGDLRRKGGPVLGAEFLTTSATSGGDGAAALPGNDIILSRNPDLKLLEDRRGYSICTLTPQSWTTDMIAFDQVTDRRSPRTTNHRFVVEHGVPGIVAS
jgi:alkaline phosphatase D